MDCKSCNESQNPRNRKKYPQAFSWYDCKWRDKVALESQDDSWDERRWWERIWFSPLEIENFCYYQCMWLIGHRETLQAGDWPAHPEGQKEAPKTQKMPSHSAYYETPEQHIGEINSRLANCNENWRNELIEQVDKGVEFEQLTTMARLVLSYIVGKNYRIQNFAKWRADKKYKLMNRPCEKCGSNRWRTVEKGKKWKCRKCGYVREVV